jgi:hypothetical protein
MASSRTGRKDDGRKGKCSGWPITPAASRSSINDFFTSTVYSLTCRLTNIMPAKTTLHTASNMGNSSPSFNNEDAEDINDDDSATNQEEAIEEGDDDGSSTGNIDDKEENLLREEEGLPHQQPAIIVGPPQESEQEAKALRYFAG